MTVAELVKQLLTIPNQELEVYVKDKYLNICAPAKTAQGEAVTTLNGLEYVFIIGGTSDFKSAGKN